MRLVPREELFEQAWKKPMSHLAAEYGITGTGLAKICRKHKIPLPPRGYWAKIAAGHKISKAMLPPRKEGQPEKISIAVHRTRPAPKREVIQLPEPISEKVVRMAVPENMQNLHRLVRAWVESHAVEQRKRLKERNSRSSRDWYWSPEPLRDLTERDQYRFKVSSGLFTAIDQAGGLVTDAKVSGRFRVKIAEEEFDCIVIEKMRKPLNPSPDARSWTAYPDHHQRGLGPTGNLRIEIEADLRGNLQTKWIESEKCRADELLPSVVGQIIAAGPILKDRRIRAEEVQRRYQQQQAELYEKRRREALEEAQFATLLQLAARQDSCESALKFIGRLREKLSDYQPGSVEFQRLNDWIEWAEQRAHCQSPLNLGLDQIFNAIGAAQPHQFGASSLQAQRFY